MGIYLNQPLKSRKGDQEWLDFFALTSSAFSHLEKLSLVPRFSQLDAKSTFKEVASAEKKLEVLYKLNSFSLAADAIAKDKGRGFYHLIVLNLSNRSVSIQSYTKDNFDHAKMEYAKVEESAAKGEKLEPVLVAVGFINSFQRAYPNFFLDTNDFANKVGEIIKLVK
jgi:hypothetical protein